LVIVAAVLEITNFKSQITKEWNACWSLVSAAVEDR